MNCENAVLATQVALIPRRIGRGGMLERADVLAKVRYEDGTAEEIAPLNLVRQGDSFRLKRHPQLYETASGDWVSALPWIEPEAFASIKVRAIEQAQAFAGRFRRW